MLPLIACGAGIYLGLHFNILVLLPFSILGAGAFIMSSWASGQSLLDSAGILLVPLIAVQAGFMLGLTARESYGQLRARLNIRQSRRI
jgi:nitric oxide reductase large subunit